MEGGNATLLVEKHAADDVHGYPPKVIMCCMEDEQDE